MFQLLRNLCFSFPRHGHDPSGNAGEAGRHHLQLLRASGGGRGPAGRMGVEGGREALQVLSVQNVLKGNALKRNCTAREGGVTIAGRHCYLKNGVFLVRTSSTSRIDAVSYKNRSTCAAGFEVGISCRIFLSRWRENKIQHLSVHPKTCL